MNTADELLRSIADDQLRERATRWYGREIERARKGQGDAWGRNREWVEDYLLAELRERLQGAIHGRA
jgi:hypothetical protein